MNLRRDQIQKALINVKKRCKAQNVPISTSDLTYLDDEALKLFENKYREGEPIDSENIGFLAETTSTILKNVARLTINQYKNGKRERSANPEEIIMLAADYIYLHSMEKMGCPDIPLYFNKAVKDTILSASKTVQNVFFPLEMSKEDSFKKQRKKDADVLISGKVGKAIAAINSKNYTIRQVGNLIAEYQALAERQKRHTGIWRFFHGAENEARNNLLANMKNAINSALVGYNFDIDKANPADIARRLTDDSVEFSIEQGMQDRFTNMEAFYGVDDIPLKQNDGLDVDSLKRDTDIIKSSENKQSERIDNIEGNEKSIESESINNEFNLF